MHYNGANSCFIVNDTEIIKFKAKDSEIAAYPLCLENVSKDWSVDNMKKIRLKGFFMILVLTMMLLQFLIFQTFTSTSLKRMTKYKMFGLIKKVVFIGITFFGCNLWSVNLLKCVSMNNQEYKVRPKIVNVNSKEPVFFFF